MLLSPKYLPTIGMVGFYKLAAPYDTLVSDTLQYACISISSLSGAISQGLDPLNAVYLAQGDTEASYTRDQIADVSLIRISASGGAGITFPSSAMLSIPISDGVVYTNTVLAVSLSAMPTDMNLEILKHELSDLVHTTLGVKATVVATSVGTPLTISKERHAAITRTRAAIVSSVDSSLSRIVSLEANRVALEEKVRVLENYILTTIPPG